MAHLLGADRLALRFGTRTLLADVTLGLDAGDRIGVVGPNGAGKSSLLRILARRQDPDAGRVTVSSGTRVALLDQRDEPAEGVTVRELVHGSAETHEWAGDAGVRAVHAGLLPDIDLDADVATLSGGQRRRVALAAVLVAEAEVVLLDEPTNHLDVEGVAWLADHLVERFSGTAARRTAGGGQALVVITHDRWFLDAVCTRTWEVVGHPRGAVHAHEGGYAAYVLARAERARLTEQAERRRGNLLRKELAWLRRGAPARTSKPKFRLEAASALIADEPPPRDPVELTALATARLGKDVIDVEGVTFGYTRPVLRDVTWRLGPGDRWGVLGPNGAGKTTLLRLLTGDLEPTSGRVRRGTTVRTALLSQDVAELDRHGDLRAVEVVERERGTATIGGRELTAAQLTERLGFTTERAWTPVRDLSGGERRRLALLRLLVGEPNVLLLDEPTNDLDTDTLAALEDLLDGWPGTLVVVSHDRYLLERVCDRHVALLGDGTVRDLPGGVEEYLALRRDARHASDARHDAGAGADGRRSADGQVAAGAGRAAPAGSSVARVDAEPQALSGAERHAAQKEMNAVERRLARLHDQVDAAQRALAEHDQSDYSALQERSEQLQHLQAEVTRLEERWLELAELLDTAPSE